MRVMGQHSTLGIHVHSPLYLCRRRGSWCSDTRSVSPVDSLWPGGHYHLPGQPGRSRGRSQAGGPRTGIGPSFPPNLAESPPLESPQGLRLEVSSSEHLTLCLPTGRSPLSRQQTTQLWYVGSLLKLGHSSVRMTASYQHSPGDQTELSCFCSLATRPSGAVGA